MDCLRDATGALASSATLASATLASLLMPGSNPWPFLSSWVPAAHALTSVDPMPGEGGEEQPATEDDT